MIDVWSALALAVFSATIIAGGVIWAGPKLDTFNPESDENEEEGCDHREV